LPYRAVLKTTGCVKKKLKQTILRKNCEYSYEHTLKGKKAGYFEKKGKNERY